MLDFQELFFLSHDNLKITYKTWVKDTYAKKIVIFLHRGHEHSGRVTHISEELDIDIKYLFAWDARGNGQSEGKRGHAENFQVLVKDLDIFVKHIQEKYNVLEEDIILIGQSFGAVIAATWVHDYAPRIHALILAAPAFDINLLFPGVKTLLFMWQKIYGRYSLTSVVKGKNLTQDIQRARMYETDTLINLKIDSGLLFDTYKNAKRIIKNASTIQTPLLLLISGADTVVFPQAQDNFFQNLGSQIKYKVVLEGFLHDTLGEKERETAFQHIRDFLDLLHHKQENLQYSFTSQIEYSFKNYQELQKALSKNTFSYWKYHCIRYTLQYLGKYISQGVYIGETYGYDSGVMLDYVYQNKTQAYGYTGVVGRYADRIYLSSVGWRAIRERKKILERYVGETTQLLRDNEIPVHILDIAAGHVRYLFDLIDSKSIHIDSLRLQDYMQDNIDFLLNTLKNKNYEFLYTCEKKDAFSLQSYLQDSSTLAISSGIFELFPDNILIEQALSGIYISLKKGGYYIYTNQAYHPQLELIARTLISHSGKQAWIMRCRSQGEMDNLVKKAGFTKISQYIDSEGIFSVSLAQK